MKKYKMFKNSFAHFSFTSGQRKGILALFFVIVLLQFLYWFLDFTPETRNDVTKTKWLSYQNAVDSLSKVNSNTPTVFPFNPNFLSDYKGYKLGMSVEEIDRLHLFRKANKFINSPQDFQHVTGVSDSLLKVLTPLFKFPSWVSQKKNYASFTKNSVVKSKIIKKDINLATSEDLIKVFGIGEVLANRILAHRDRLGGFVAMEQLNDVWGLKPEVVTEVMTNFIVLKKPVLNLIDINNATQKELQQFYYFKYPIVKQILIYRSMNGDFENIEDLSKIKDFPLDKAKIIALYLKF
ncbi:ComEA family DNA-binding protein [Flavobacterium sp. TSSA_36]|uniref:ComEA family DNA-binding protein n=1 Tax=Flavobacterium sp. TSSA_36 TaxID=3447669 RepID=UPI003F2E9036